MDAQDERGPVVDGGGIVGDARPVRGADLPELRPRLAQDVGNAEAAADLDELAPGDDGFPPVRQRGEDEEDRRGVVVDHRRRRRTRHLGQEPGGMGVTGAAPALREVVLQVRVAGRQRRHPRRRRRREGGASEVGVHDHPGRVDHRGEGRLEAGRQRRRRAPLDRRRRLLAVPDGRRVRAAQVPPYPIGGLAQRVDGGLAAVLGLEGADDRALPQAIDGRQDAGGGHGAGAPGRRAVLPLRPDSDTIACRAISGRGACANPAGVPAPIRCRIPRRLGGAAPEAGDDVRAQSTTGPALRRPRFR